MPILVQALAFAAMASFGASIWAAYLAWPKFRNLERRGVVKKPVPDLMGNGNTNGGRAWTLLWATEIPSDRPSLYRLVLFYRVAVVLSMVLMICFFVAMQMLSMPTQTQPTDAPPPVTLSLATQDQ